MINFEINSEDFMQNTAERIQGIADSIFGIISKLAFEYKAVNLGQGFPDFSGPDWIIQSAYEAMKEGKNQYAPPQGIYSLRKVIHDVYQKYYSIEFDFEKEITITAGATEALFSTFLALINSGDEVILFEPFYDAYLSDVILAGGIPKFVTLHKPNFEFDFKELEQTISNRTKAIVINNPQNPTGKVFSIEELEFIYELARKHDLYVVSDEVYEFLTYDGLEHTSSLKFDPGRERTIMISSTGKTFSMTGWKIGWAISNPKITNAIRKIHQWTTFAVNTPGQHAMAFAFSKIDEYLPQFRSEYQERRDFIYNHLLSTKFKPFKPLGSYFLMVEFPQIEGIDDFEMSNLLIKKFGVATIPPSPFYKKSDEGKTMLRICFAKTIKTLREGVNRLAKFYYD